MDNEKFVSIDAKPQDQNEANQNFSEQEIPLDSEDFEALVDVFRTLLQWSRDLEDATQNG
jgi:hypothetical protein